MVAYGITTASGQWTEVSRDRQPNCEGRLYLPASGGIGLGLDGRVNTCELSINSVTADKLKMLISLSQKAREKDEEFIPFLT